MQAVKHVPTAHGHAPRRSPSALMKAAILGLATLAALGLAAAHPQTARAQNLVSNPGFETGDFTDWTITGGSRDSFVGDGFVNSGNFSAYLGSIQKEETLSQDIQTVAGQNYTFSFFFAGDGDDPSNFTAYFGGDKVFSVTNPPFDATFQPYSFNVVAQGAQTTVSFVSRDDPYYLNLDDVSVTPTVTPEPSAVTGLALGVLSLGALALRSRKRPSPTA